MKHHTINKADQELGVNSDQGIDLRQNRTYTLQQAALIALPSRDTNELLDKIFDGKITPSCLIRSDLLTYWTDVQKNPGKENPRWPLDEWESQQVFPDNLPEQVLVDVLLKEESRNTGSASGIIQLLVTSGGKTGRLFSPALHLPIESFGYVRCHLSHPVEIEETELVIRQDNLEYFIRNNPAAKERLEAYNESSALIARHLKDKTEHIQQPISTQPIKLPIIGGSEVIPVRLIPLVTEPEISPKQLLDCLYNPRGDFLKHLDHSPFHSDWTLIYKEMSTNVNSGTGKQLEQFPKGIHVTKSDFEEHEYVVSKAIRLKLDRAIPDALLILALEGFEVSSPLTQKKHKNPNNKNRSNNLKSRKDILCEKNLFIKDALSAYFASKAKYPNTVDILITNIEQGMQNKNTENWYTVTNKGTSPENYLTLDTKKGNLTFPYNEIKRAFHDMKKKLQNPQ